MPLGDRYCEDERLLTYWLVLFLNKAYYMQLKGKNHQLVCLVR